MKVLLPLIAIFLLCVSAENCGEKKKEKTLYKGKLEIKALCMNYTIRLIEGKLDTSLVAANWKDENTGISYTNAFGLANPCDFPSTINQGDEFYFSIDTSKTKKDCIVCMAYYPTPPKKLSVKIIPK
jgi:hypothetical protein